MIDLQANGKGATVMLTGADGHLFYQKSISPAADLPPTLVPVGWAVGFGMFTLPPRIMVGGK
jgi:hypothetical protein